MDENLHDIENLFHSALEDNEEIPSQRVWEAVDRQLDKDKIITIKKKYTNLKRIVVLLLLLVVGFSLYNLYVNKPANGKLVVQNSDRPVLDKQNKSDRPVDNTVNKKTETAQAVATNTNNILPGSKGSAVRNAPDSPGFGIKRRTGQQTAQVKVAYATINKSKVVGEVIFKNQKDAAFAHTKKHKYEDPLKIEDSSVDNKEKKEEVLAIDFQQVNETPLPKSPVENISLNEDGTTDTKKRLALTTVSKLAIPAATIAMINKKDKKAQRKAPGFAVQPFFSPDVAWYHLEDNDDNMQTNNAGEIEKQERHLFSFTYGVLIDDKISNHWGLQSGITVSNINIVVAPTTIYARKDNSGRIKYKINTSSGYGYVLPKFIHNPEVGDSLHAFSSTHSLQYIGLPLAVTYRFLKNRFGFNALAGVSANILTRAKLETEVSQGINRSNERIDNLQGVKNIYLNGLAGVSVDYRLINKTALTFEPIVRFAINPINKDAVVVKSYPKSFGFAVGLRFGL